MSDQPPVKDMGDATEYGDRICPECNQQVWRRHRCLTATASSQETTQPAVERETADLLTDLPRYEPKDLAKEVRGGAKASPLVGIWRESNSGVMPVLKWSDIEALRGAPRETRTPEVRQVLSILSESGYLGLPVDDAVDIVEQALSLRSAPSREKAPK